MLEFAGDTLERRDQFRIELSRRLVSDCRYGLGMRKCRLVRPAAAQGIVYVGHGREASGGVNAFARKPIGVARAVETLRGAIER